MVLLWGELRDSSIAKMPMSQAKVYRMQKADFQGIEELENVENMRKYGIRN